jgi:hypothetical protein
VATTHTPLQFTPSIDPRPPEGGGLWFVSRGRELLVGEDFRVPRGVSPADFGLTPRRVQLLGRLGGETCFSAGLAPQADPPPAAWGSSAPGRCTGGCPKL